MRPILGKYDFTNFNRAQDLSGATVSRGIIVNHNERKMDLNFYKTYNGRGGNRKGQKVSNQLLSGSILHLTFLHRIIFIRDYTLKSLRLKHDKWNKLIISDEQRTILTNFVERG